MREHKLQYDLNDMLFNIPKEMHELSEINRILQEHKEVQFVSLVGIDMGGHDTDEKIPVKVFLDDMEEILNKGVQTDGSSVVLPGIADLNNAKVDIVPDLEANWYVDYNYSHIDHQLGLPIGTLRIPSFLIHNEDFQCGARVVLRDAIASVKNRLMAVLKKHPYIFEYLDGSFSYDDIDDIILTSATELEFWVKTPDDKGDREQLFTAQMLKEQYWKRTYGPVRTALEETLTILDKYGFEVEMGHKEVGGVKARMSHSGSYDHVMEQMEIDWKYADAMQAADNEKQVKYVVRDVFTKHSLDVTFMAKPFDGVAGSGEHTHLGMAACLKDGRIISLFAPKDMKEDFMSPVGYGALMGLLKNYDVVNPFVNATNDSLNRLKPGYEAPVCTVTSLGRSVEEPSRNRTVLAGLIRDVKNPLATRFELRSPCPKSNSYLVIATSYMAIIDGIENALEAERKPKELEKAISKEYGQEDLYLEKNRVYRSENNVFSDYTKEERDKLFGKAPATVWENLQAFEEYKDKLEIFKVDNVMIDVVIESYRSQMLHRWKTELHDRLIPQTRLFIRECKMLHQDGEFTDYDRELWQEINQLRYKLGKDGMSEKSLLTRAMEALEKEDYSLASDLQLEIKKTVAELRDLYNKYKKNLF